MARTHLCVGCQVIAETQEQAQKDGLGHGIKVHLVPVQVAAALDLQRDLKSGKRTTNE